MSLRDQLGDLNVSPHAFAYGEVWSIRDHKVLFPTRDPDKVDPKKPRLILVLQNDRDNQNPLYETVIVAPLTTSMAVTKQCFILETAESGLHERSLIKLGFIQPILKVQIHERKAVLPPDTMRRIKAVLAKNLALIP